MLLSPMFCSRRMAGCLFGGAKALASSGFHAALSGMYASLAVGLSIAL